MNASPSIELTPVDRIKVTTLLDNYVDVLMASGPMVQRPPLTKTDTIPTDTPRGRTRPLAAGGSLRPGPDAHRYAGHRL